MRINLSELQAVKEHLDIVVDKARLLPDVRVLSGNITYLRTLQMQLEAEIEHIAVSLNEYVATLKNNNSLFQFIDYRSNDYTLLPLVHEQITVLALALVYARSDTYVIGRDAQGQYEMSPEVWETAIQQWIQIQKRIKETINEKKN